MPLKWSFSRHAEQQLKPIYIVDPVISNIGRAPNQISMYILEFHR